MRPQSKLARTPLSALSALATLFVSGHALAADVKAGEWDLSIGGIVNAYYTNASCSGSQAVGGAALATKALGCGGQDGSTIIGNGLLPNVLSVGAKGKQEGVDIGATLMIGSAVSSSSSIGNNNNVDIRQGFFTIGTAEAGTLKLGRDYGMFGAGAILSDMTLLGAGAPVAATQRNRVTLGHIGAGYTYLGHYGQLTYSTPKLGAAGFSIGLMSPVDADATHVAKRSPQVQAKGTLDVGVGTAWIAIKSQGFKGVGGGSDFTMNGAEIGANLSFGDAGLLANFQSGKGMGVLADGDNGDHKSTNWLIQGTYKFGKAKVGLSVGASRPKDGTGDALKENMNTTAGLYYSLTKAVTLVGEISNTESKSVSGNKAKMSGVSLGGILFF